jgi:DNA polymerase III psi subunit
MTPHLASYLFNKETLYRKAFIEIKSMEELETVVEKTVVKQVTPPISTPNKDVKKPSLPSYVFKHQVAILTDSISDNEKLLLSKILGAIGLSIEQVDLIELNKVHSIDYQSFISQNTTKKFISFGIGLGKINWNILLNIYQPKNISGVDFLLSDELRVLDTNIELKKTLWNALKVMFTN